MKKKEENVYVTKTFMPPMEEYIKYLDEIWDSSRLTNQGPILKKFESTLQEYLDIKNLHFVINGTIALQLVIKALDLENSDIITTPFSYVATTSAILWEKCNPIFVDIDQHTLCIDADKIEASITENTKAILAVHVFGHPCDVEKIEEIAKRNNLKVIYDAAHAFGVKYNGKSLLGYGDASICSFHSTKLFHTIEGGCIFLRDSVLSEKINLMKRFGHHGDEHYCLGINAKASEFQAAMGLCNFKYLKEIINSRKKLSQLYDDLLGKRFYKFGSELEYNYAYYPLVFEREEQVLKLLDLLNAQNIFPRRYFYPSLNKLPYLNGKQNCPVSEDISSRILCLPLYPGLSKDVVVRICESIKNVST